MRSVRIVAGSCDLPGGDERRGRSFKVPQAFAGQSIALRPTTEDGVWDAVFIAHELARIDLHEPVRSVQPVTHVPEHL